MLYICSDYSLEETLNKIDKAILEYSWLDIGKYGYVGRVDKNNDSLWILNQSNIYSSVRGFRIRSFRRFVGIVNSTRSGSEIRGAFKIRPLYKLSIIIYFVFMTSILVIGLLFTSTTHELLRVAGVSIGMILVGIGVILFNIHKCKEVEEEIINFLKDILIQ